MSVLSLFISDLLTQIDQLDDMQLEALADTLKRHAQNPFTNVEAIREFYEMQIEHYRIDANPLKRNVDYRVACGLAGHLAFAVLLDLNFLSADQSQTFWLIVEQIVSYLRQQEVRRLLHQMYENVA